MPEIDRRTAAMFALLAPLASGGAMARSSQRPSSLVQERAGVSASGKGGEQIAMLIYDGMTLLDLAGPHCMFGSLKGARIHLVAKSLTPITTDDGMTIVPDATFETCPRDVTVLFTPGGTDGTLAAAVDPQTLAFMADRGSRARYVTSVCSGSLVLGAAGLLKGYKATSHWSCRDALRRFGAIPTEGRVVRDRNRFTGGGVTAGLDFGLTMVAELRDRTYAECTQLSNEYDPEPPFDAGSPRSASPAVREAVTNRLSDFIRKANELPARADA